MDLKLPGLKCLSGIDAEVFEFVAQKNSPVTRKPIKDLNTPLGSIFGGIIRDKESYIAIGDFQIKEEDKVVALCFPKAISKVEKMFRPKTFL